ncbi:S8 family serine peptidase [Streptomyces marincola]|uniref:S8 family serine peptidase n=1 Tax=Streptomyces marincola TaxID=2878388 RepID=UPI001CF29097|nr:S8 family serine peptidase [Streptomyces marincola]UCM90808.1 S8 family serine peptidase [Streptomyces marincola]
MDTMRMGEVWERARGEGVTVAVLDTGTRASLPSLEGRVLEGADFTRGAEGAHEDVDGHGTMMSALIAGTGAEGGIPGLVPEAQILPVRVDTGAYDFNQHEWWIQGIEYAVESGADIISMSLAGPDLGGMPELQEAIALAARNDVLIFAGSGNEGAGANTVMVPAALDGVVGVGAVDRRGERVDYSTYGPQVSLAAPGNEVPGPCPGGSYQPACISERGGTSSATALASASAALIWSAHPEWTKNQVLRVMLETADGPEGAERDDFVGYGMVRPDRVILDGEGDPGDPDVNPLFEEYEAALDPPASPEPEPEPEPEAAPEPQGARGEGGDVLEVPLAEAGAGAASGEGGGGAGPLALAGVVGVVVLGGVAAAMVFNRRKRMT